MDEQLYYEALRTAVVLQELWHDRRDRAQLALQGATIVRYAYRPEAWPPSYIVARRGTAYEVYAQGTSNNYQLWPHARGAIATRYQGAPVHTGMLWAGRDMMFELGDLLAEGSSVTIYGHSYGGGAAQILADELVLQQYPPGKLRVLTLGSPKVYTDVHPAPEHRVDLIHTSADPVPCLPTSLQRVMEWDEIIGWIPIPQPLINWGYRGTEHWITYDGKVWDSWYATWGGATQSQHWLFSNHLFDTYKDFLQKVEEQEGWPRSERVKQLLDLDAAAPEGDPADRHVPETTNYPGGPPDPLGSSFLPVSGAIKGLSMATEAIKCQALMSSDGSMFTETYYYVPTSPTVFNLQAAQVAFENLMTQRIKIGAPKVRYGVHYKVESLRYSFEGVKRKAWTDWTIDLTPPTNPNPAQTPTADVEPAFTGYLTRIFAGELASRTLLFRPLPNTAQMNASGVRLDQLDIRNQIATFVHYMRDAGIWGIKCQDLAANPEKDLVFATVGPLTGGLVDLTVPAHGYTGYPKVKIYGEGPEGAWARGMYRVEQIMDDNTLRVRVKKVPVTGPLGLKIRKVTYHYPLITEYSHLRLSKRDTGNPITRARGRR